MWDEGRPATHEDRGRAILYFGTPSYRQVCPASQSHPHTGRYAPRLNLNCLKSQLPQSPSRPPPKLI